MGVSLTEGDVKFHGASYSSAGAKSNPGFFRPDLKEQGQELSLKPDRLLDRQVDADRLPEAQEDPPAFLVPGPDFVLGELDLDHFPARSIEVVVIS